YICSWLEKEHLDDSLNCPLPGMFHFMLKLPWHLVFRKIGLVRGTNQPSRCCLSDSQFFSCWFGSMQA
ncbi:MAG: hypothetical protein M3044_06885, partial [Thermoproteota archaeon]|nr:hypothetical protein [Thermoproteota archaeon]